MRIYFADGDGVRVTELPTPHVVAARRVVCSEAPPGQRGFVLFEGQWFEVAMVTLERVTQRQVPEAVRAEASTRPW